jgi:hypothetical protein
MGTLSAKSAGFYAFLLNMWIMRKITAEQLHTYVPTFITEEEYQMIIATPQVPE